VTKLKVRLSSVQTLALCLSIILTVAQPALALDCGALLTQWKSHVSQVISRHLIRRAYNRAIRTRAQADWNSLTNVVADHLTKVDPNLQFKIIKGGMGNEFIRFFSSPNSDSELGRQITDILGRFTTNIQFFPEQLRGAKSKFEIFGSYSEFSLPLEAILDPFVLPGTVLHEKVHIENYFGFIVATLREGPGTIEGFNRLYGYQELFSLDEFEAHLAGFQWDTRRTLSRSEKRSLAEIINFCLRYATEASQLLDSLRGKSYASSSHTARNGEIIVTAKWTIYVIGQTKPVIISFPFYRDISKDLDEQVRTILQNKISTIEKAASEIRNITY